jgi:periplasmic protein TorT
MMRGRILAAPTDFPVLQGWLSVEMAVRALEKRLVLTHAGPPILMVKSDTVDQTPVHGSLAPASFVPVCSLEAKEPTDVSPKSRLALSGR